MRCFRTIPEIFSDDDLLMAPALRSFGNVHKYCSYIQVSFRQFLCKLYYKEIFGMGKAVCSSPLGPYKY